MAMFITHSPVHYRELHIRKTTPKQVRNKKVAGQNPPAVSLVCMGEGPARDKTKNANGTTGSGSLFFFITVGI